MAGRGALTSGILLWALMWVDLDPFLQLGAAIFLAAALAIFGALWGGLVPAWRKNATRRARG